MIRFLLVLFTIFISILFSQRFLSHIKIFYLRKKIKNNLLIGIKQIDGSYHYKERGYTLGYNIRELPTGIKTVEWLFLKRRLNHFEEKMLSIKNSFNKFFLYQRWGILFRPQVVIILMVSLAIFYFGIKEEHPSKRIERFKWIASQITGISPDSIKYTGGGWFDISGRKKYIDGREIDPVTISFNPLGWLFFQDTAHINRWNPKLNKYLTYSFTIDDRGDVWLGKKDSQIHGKVQADKIIWDEPAGTSRYKGHDITVEDGKIRFIDR